MSSCCFYDNGKNLFDQKHIYREWIVSRQYIYKQQKVMKYYFCTDKVIPKKLLAERCGYLRMVCSVSFKTGQVESISRNSMPQKWVRKKQTTWKIHLAHHLSHLLTNEIDGIMNVDNHHQILIHPAIPSGKHLIVSRFIVQHDNDPMDEQDLQPWSWTFSTPGLKFQNRKRT